MKNRNGSSRRENQPNATMEKRKAQRLCIVAVILLAVTLIVFWRVQEYGFVWDDGVNVAENLYLNPVTLPHIARFWQRPYQHLYVPLTYTLWGTIAHFARVTTKNDNESKLSPRLFHVANVVFHALSALVVFAILRRLIGDEWAAGAGAALFALHPMQVEAVAWITGMKDVLAGFLSLVAIWQYLAYAATEGPGHPSAPIRRGEKKLCFVVRKRMHYAIAILAFMLAVLAKPAAVVTPIMAWLLDAFILRRSLKQSATSLSAWIAIAIPFVIMTKLQQADALLSHVSPPWARPFIAADALAFYIYKLFVPFWLGPGYGRSPEVIFEEGWAYLTWVIPLGLGVGIGFLRRREPWSVAAAGLFVAALLPVLGLVPFAFQYWSTVADRYIYLAMLGPALALSCIIAKPWSQRRWVRVSCGTVLLLLSVKSFSQAEIWHNSQTLWQHALDVGQESALAHTYLGANLVESNLERALYHLRRAVRLDPDYFDARYNLSLALAQAGRFAEAIDHYRVIVGLRPRDPILRDLLGVALAGNGQFDEAITEYRLALQLNPNDVKLHHDLGNALADRGLLDEAIEHYRYAIRIDPDYAGARFNLGIALADRGDLEGAVRQYERTLQLKPDHSKAHNNLAVILIRQGRREQAIEHFRQALRYKPDFPEAQRGLAQILEQTGKDRGK